MIKCIICHGEKNTDEPAELILDGMSFCVEHGYEHARGKLKSWEEMKKQYG